MAQQPGSSTILEASGRDYQTARQWAERSPLPAVVDNIACGTAGWTDPTLVRGGLFYPRSIKTARDRLVFYARHFSFVEVDATYYALLPPAQAESWLSYAPPTFAFDIKAHPMLTGQPFESQRLPAHLKEELEREGLSGRLYGERLPAGVARRIEALFDDFLRPLLDARRLGAVLLQFPPWFGRSSAHVRRIEQLAERWGHAPLAVEFRNPSWLSPDNQRSTLSLLTSRQMSLVLVDAPAETGLAEMPLWVTNARLAIVRFHGRNRAGWQQKGGSVHDRFSYLYSPEELRPWSSRLRRIAEEAERVHATFNNCYRDYAVLNAREMAAFLLEDDAAHPSGTDAGAPLSEES